MYRGDIRLGDTIDLKFSTVNTAAAPTTLAGSPVVSAYVGNGTTEITAGITLTVDFDGRTGLHNVRVVATSGNGFATATNVDLVITAGTVGGVSVVGMVIGSFSIENRSALMPTTAARTFDVTATGAGGVDWGNVENPTTAVGLSGTTVKTATDVETDTADIQSRLPAALVSGRMDSSVGAMAAAVLTAAAIAADAITAAKIATGAIDADALAADAITEIQAAILSDATPFAGANVNATISSRATPAQVNAEVLDVIGTDTFAEPSGVPAFPMTLVEMQRRVVAALIHGLVVDSNTGKLQFKNAAGTVIWEKDLTDAGGVYEETAGNVP